MLRSPFDIIYLTILPFWLTCDLITGKSFIYILVGSFLFHTFIAPEVTLATTEAKAKMADAGSDSVTLTFVDPFDQRNGRITAYSVVVTTDKADTDINEGLLNKWRDRKKSWLVSYIICNHCLVLLNIHTTFFACE